MRWFSMLNDGARGFSPQQASQFEPVEEVMEEEDIHNYGVDWDAYQDSRIQEHHAAHNPTDPFPQNPFVAHSPETYNMVHVDETRCPFTDEELLIFQYNLNLLPHNMRTSRDMDQRKQLWICALNICGQIRDT